MIIVITLLAISYSSVYGATVLHRGTKGRVVIEVQSYLYRLKYIKKSPDGFYGKITQEAVKSFQLENNLTADGIVGPITMKALREAVNFKTQMIEHIVNEGESLAEIAEQYNSSITAIMIKNKLSTNQVEVGVKLLIPSEEKMLQVSSRGRMSGVQMIPWSIVNQLWNNGEKASIVDVETGKSFQVSRLYGYYHADIEPLTKVDTNILKEIYGGKWSWSRRAVIVRIRNLCIAASINGMPHGKKSIPNNGCPGQICAHFLGSRVHQNSSVDSDHLLKIKQAFQVDLNLINVGQPVEETEVIEKLPIY